MSHRFASTPSPAAAEAARLARAEQAMKQFCIDLSGLVGRTLDSAKLDLENLDLVTAEIYTAAVEAGIDINAVMSADAKDVASTLEGRAPWLGNCYRVVAKLRRNVPEAAYYRILEVWTGTKEDATRDPDAKGCLEYAAYFFDGQEHDVDGVVDLATCLLDYAFTRQGLDDELARVTKKKPVELQKALVEAGGGKEEFPAPRSSKRGIGEHLESIKYDLFVIAVKRALRLWKPELVMDIIKMHPDSVYRMAMHHNGHPTGDSLVSKIYAGTVRHKDKHPSILVTIGHAALSLEVLMSRRDVDPTDHGIQLVKEFCRTCGSGLQRGRHGCCMTDRMTQATELQEFAKAELRSRQAVPVLRDLQNLWDAQPDTRKWFHQNPHRPSRRSNVHGPAVRKRDSYELRTTPLLDGSPDKLEVHLDIWEDGIWQEVPSLEAADRFAVRALQEAERARALTRPQRQGDATDPGGDYRVVQTMRDSPINKNSTAKAGPMKGDPTIEQLIVCKYPTCSKFATRSYGRYCEHHARVMSEATCATEDCSTNSETGSDFCAHHRDGHLDGVIKALEDHNAAHRQKELAAPTTTALATVERQREELELRELTSQTNFGKSLRWLAVVLGGVTAVVTQSLMVIPFVAVAFVMAYALVDRKAIEKKKRALEETSS